MFHPSISLQYAYFVNILRYLKQKSIVDACDISDKAKPAVIAFLSSVSGPTTNFQGAKL